MFAVWIVSVGPIIRNYSDTRIVFVTSSTRCFEGRELAPARRTKCRIKPVFKITKWGHGRWKAVQNVQEHFGWKFMSIWCLYSILERYMERTLIELCGQRHNQTLMPLHGHVGYYMPPFSDMFMAKRDCIDAHHPFQLSTPIHSVIVFSIRCSCEPVVIVVGSVLRFLIRDVAFSNPYREDQIQVEIT